MQSQGSSRGRYDSGHESTDSSLPNIEASTDVDKTPQQNRRHRQAATGFDAVDSAPPARMTGNERLYEGTCCMSQLCAEISSRRYPDAAAYNELHALAQVFEKPFDAPAILVVGHQTDGKSGACKEQAGAITRLLNESSCPSQL